MRLNPQQEEAADHLTGPMLIVAGAGSGKTRTLTEKVARLIESGVANPGEILAVTFTNKAADEMRARVQHRVGDQAAEVKMGTFHAICAGILRREIGRFGLDSSFSIYDRGDQMATVKTVLDELEIDQAAQKLVERIGLAKSYALGVPDVEARAQTEIQKVTARVYRAYQEALRKANALDFDDLLLYGLRLFERFPDALARYQDRFRFVLVDEFQDTNAVQYQWVRLLVQQHRNLTVVGDPDQSIYSWRGANIANLRRLETDFPEGQTVVLDQNYRSTGTVLATANALIQRNSRRHKKNLWTANGSGEPISFFEAEDEDAEGDFIAAEIRRLVAAGRAPVEIAVLYRTNAQSRAIEEALEGIPYRIVGGLRFYDRREVKDLAAYLRLTLNHRDLAALRRAVKVPRRGIGAAALEAIEEAAAGGDLVEVMSAGTAKLNTKAASGAKDLAELVLAAGRWAEDAGPGMALRFLAQESGYLKLLEGEEDGEERAENLEALFRKADEFGPGEASEFLAAAVLAGSEEDEDSGGAVTLTTIHAAKGLEYPAVFIAGLEEGLLPHRKSDTPETVEEERRLLYVGITRAMERMYISWCKERGGRATPSRFLKEIPREVPAAQVPA